MTHRAIAGGSEANRIVPALCVGMHPRRSASHSYGMVVRGEAEFHGNRNDEILNPSLIVEVLSPSTERYDRGEKFRKYRSLPSLQDYLLISAEEPYIEHYCKTDPVAWTFTSYGEIDAALWFSNLQLSIPLAEIYRRVNFPIS